MVPALDANEFSQKVFEKLYEIEKDMKSIKNDVSSLKNDVALLKDDMAVLKDDVESLKEDQGSLKDGQEKILQAIAEIKEDVTYAVHSSDENRKELYKIKQRMLP